MHLLYAHWTRALLHVDLTVLIVGINFNLFSKHNNHGSESRGKAK